MASKYLYEKWSAVKYWREVDADEPGSILINTYDKRITVSDLIWGTTGVTGNTINVPLNTQNNTISIKKETYLINPYREYIDYKGFEVYRWDNESKHYIVKADGWTVEEYIETEPYSNIYKHTRNGYMPGGSYVMSIKGSYYMGERFYGIIESDEPIYPKNGYKDGYWYISLGLKFPQMNILIDKKKRNAINGWVKINNTLKKITSISMKIKNELKNSK